jgi:hypothetical protein
MGHPAGTETFVFSVRPNPKDEENPPAQTQPEPNCDPYPFNEAAPTAPSTEFNLTLKAPGATECHYKLTFTFTNPRIAPIDPHIAVGK